MADKTDDTIDPTAEPVVEEETPADGVEEPVVDEAEPTTEETPSEDVVEAPAEGEAEPVVEDEAPAEPVVEETADGEEIEATPGEIDAQGRQTYNVKCSNCGKDTNVPFKPTAGRPVYDRDCLMKSRESRNV
jgi:CxxC-x17-CxxC domain-containing protein